MIKMAITIAKIGRSMKNLAIVRLPIVHWR